MRSLSSILVAWSLPLLTIPVAASATSALDAFAARWPSITSYTSTATVHEVRGDRTQDRTYTIAFLKPSFLKVDVISGADRGASAVWKGGDTLTARQAGVFSFVRLRLNINDPRALSLRGDNITSGDLGTMVRTFEASTAHRTEIAGPVIDGAPTTEIVETYDTPTPQGATKDELFLSNATHLPVQRLRFAGDQLIKSERYSNTVINPPLTPSDF